MRPPLEIVAPLPGVEIVSGHHPDVVATLRYDDSEPAACIGFSIVHEAAFTLDVLFLDRNRIVKERLLYLVALDPVRSNFTEVAPVPIKHYTFDCICNA